jgi:hypothetical protein
MISCKESVIAILKDVENLSLKKIGFLNERLKKYCAPLM